VKKLDTHFIYIIAGVIVLAFVFIIVFGRKRSHKKIDVSVLNEVFDKNNIESLEFVRNKIVMTFKNIDQVEFENLKKYGAQGINIIGNKIKFYVSSKKEENEKAYQALQEYIER
jgi:hypothetical protein